jgi:hypothetical protein
LGQLVERARGGDLYPAVILYGGSAEDRQNVAVELARTLLCEREAAAERPCGACRHCRRIAWPGRSTAFHPDFAVLERDLKTVTSAEATRDFLRVAHSMPFEARGQVFVVAEADSLSAEAGDALLKLLEEPGRGAPRHFFLLAPSRLDLTPTLRSRSLARYLGAADAGEQEQVVKVAADLTAVLARWATGGGGIYLLEAAACLKRAGEFEDPRAEAPWSTAARAVARAADAEELPPALRPRLHALAEDLLTASPMRLRGIAAERILEGLLSRHLAR